MPVVKETYTPPGYDPNLYNVKTLVKAFDYYDRLNDIVVDSTDHSKAFILGKFYNPYTVFGFYAYGIVAFNSNDHSFSPYSNCFYNSVNVNEVYSLLQASNGNHYVGGNYASQLGQTLYFGRKTPTGTAFTYSVNLNAPVISMKELGGQIYFSGSFNLMNASPCSPVLYMNALNNGSVSLYGNISGITTGKMEYFNGAFFTSVTNSPAYVQTSSGGAWTSVGTGLNGPANDLLLAGGKLYVAGNITANANQSTLLNYVNEFNGSDWVKTGSNNLPGRVNDLEYHNNTLYACGQNFIYYLDSVDHKWKSIYSPSNVTLGNVYKIVFLNEKLYLLENQSLFVLTK
jgi:hypothetical protein